MIYLIVADVFWSLCALVVDIPKLSTIPFYLWAFALICPLYPAILAIIWWQYSKKITPNSYLVAFGGIGSVLFGLLAVLYYPILMTRIGFNWNDLGQIFWVLFYGIQGFFVLKLIPLRKLSKIIAISYFILKLILDFKYNSFGYLDLEALTFGQKFFLLVVAFIFIILVHLKKPVELFKKDYKITP